MIPKQVTSEKIWEHQGSRVQNCSCPSDCELSNQQPAANIPETEMLTNHCPLVTQVRHNSPLQILVLDLL